MAARMNDSTHTKVIELLALAREHDLSVNISIHDMPVGTTLEAMQDGLIERIEPGAMHNPPTGRLGDLVSIFTDGPRPKSKGA